MCCCLLWHGISLELLVNSGRELPWFAPVLSFLWYILLDANRTLICLYNVRYSSVKLHPISEVFFVSHMGQSHWLSFWRTKVTHCRNPIRLSADDALELPLLWQIKDHCDLHQSMCGWGTLQNFRWLLPLKLQVQGLGFEVALMGSSREVAKQLDHDLSRSRKLTSRLRNLCQRLRILTSRLETLTSGLRSPLQDRSVRGGLRSLSCYLQIVVVENSLQFHWICQNACL